MALAEAAVSQAAVRTRVVPVAAAVSPVVQAEAADSPAVVLAAVAVVEPFADKKKRARWRSFLIIRLQEGLDELYTVEALKVGHLFTETDILHRNLKLVANSDDYASFGSTVEFGNGERRDLCSSGKLSRLFKSILTRRTI